MKRKKKSAPVLHKISDGFTVNSTEGKPYHYHGIFTTTDYDKIGVEELNRPIKPKHVASLGESIAKHGILGVICIVAYIKSRYVYVDGQHRAQFLKELGLPITLSLVTVNDEMEMFKLMSDINNKGESWSLKIYVQGWAQFHNTFKDVLKFKEEYDLTYGVIATLLSGKSTHHATKALKDGTLTTISRAKTIKFIKAINRFYMSMNSRLINYSYTTEGFIRFVNNISLEKYLIIEDAFLKSAMEYHKDNYNQATFAKAKESHEFFVGAYEPWTD